MNGSTLLRFLAAALLASFAFASPARAEDPAPKVHRDVDLVLVLDSSASMKGLIDAARDKLSRVITSIATAQPEPNLRLALLTYGSPTAELEGHVTIQSPLTYNFDRVFDRLDHVEVSGGHEHVARALYYTLTQLNWTRDSLRIVFVAGNESADQDREYRMENVAKEAAKGGVRVNAIYCGGSDDGVSDTWRTLAKAGKGRFANIDHNHGTVTVATPFDKELASLSTRLTRTYLSGGAPKPMLAGVERADRRAAALGLALAAERAIAKATPLFRLPGDRLDDEVPGDDAADDEDARRITKERAAVRERIRALGVRRDAHVAARMKRDGLDDALAFDRVVRDALRAQLGAAGFKFR